MIFKMQIQLQNYTGKIQAQKNTIFVSFNIKNRAII